MSFTATIFALMMVHDVNIMSVAFKRNCEQQTHLYDNLVAKKCDAVDDQSDSRSFWWD